MSKQSLEKILAVATILILAAAWVAGGMRVQDASLLRIKNISSEIENVRQVSDSVYEGNRKGDASDKLYIGLAGHPSYGGILQVAVVVNKDEVIECVALVQSTDTSTYIDRVLGDGVLDAFLGAKEKSLPQVDTVSGATLSSTAIIKGVHKATSYIRGEAVSHEGITLSPKEWAKAGLSLCLFALAFFISSKAFRWNKIYARLCLLAVSTVLLGFMWASQPSLSTIALLLSGLWTGGLASYTSMICLLFAGTVFFLSKKNLYCTMICPFGGIQEGLGRITKCSPPKKTEWMKWIARGFALVGLSVALYFRSPFDAGYEPFGIAFSFIGSTALFALAVIIIVASLVVKRPWCTLLCPAGPLFDYFAFMRRWLTGSKKKRKNHEI
ncbi:4Fe-4S binding protein [Desulfobaculum bizertense]|uniref:FMN-binding protein n=1 Tax=Desulfobaculum bizertense TaxID=376490 RepID=UPI001F34660A|nr:4Fe-4S binding protein [Desulfobaculum bizertense]UIJ37557.1 4Fe-4S binding protein [Desulfobaculum bizertense]